MPPAEASPTRESTARPPVRALKALFSDPQFLGAMLAGPIVWWLIALWSGANVAAEFPPPLLREHPLRFAMLVLAYPILEEFVFRGVLQPSLAARMRGRALPGVSTANIVTSALFALAHLLYHPPAIALATFFPSIVFGHMRDRYQHLVPGMLLHAFYNAGYFWMFG